MGRACRCVNEMSLTATNSSTALLTLTLTLALALAVRPGDVLTQSVTYRPENNSYVLPRNPQAREQLVYLTLSLATVRRCAERGRKGRLAGRGPRLTDTHPRTHAPTPTTRTTHHATRNTQHATRCLPAGVGTTCSSPRSRLARAFCGTTSWRPSRRCRRRRPSSWWSTRRKWRA